MFFIKYIYLQNYLIYCSLQPQIGSYTNFSVYLLDRVTFWLKKFRYLLSTLKYALVCPAQGAPILRGYPKTKTFSFESALIWDFYVLYLARIKVQLVATLGVNGSHSLSFEAGSLPYSFIKKHSTSNIKTFSSLSFQAQVFSLEKFFKFFYLLRGATCGIPLQLGFSFWFSTFLSLYFLPLTVVQCAWKFIQLSCVKEERAYRALTQLFSYTHHKRFRNFFSKDLIPLSMLILNYKNTSLLLNFCFCQYETESCDCLCASRQVCFRERFHIPK